MDKAQAMMDVINQVIIGKEKVVKKVWMTILSQGHVLLEDVPGVGKTTMALAFSKALGLDYKRMQFTPDVMPSDVIGFYYYDKESAGFKFRNGAVMTNLLLADEINRTSSRTQSALLEVMEEGQVTVDGNTHKVPDPFFVIATQNPVGSSGTQMLPEAQLDRFMVMLSMGYPSIKEEINLMRDRGKKNPLEDVCQVISKADLLQMQAEVNEIYTSPLIYEYIALLADATRNHPMVQLGVSPRGSLALCRMAKAGAYLAGRDYVVPEDVQEVVVDVFRHRMIMKSRAKMSSSSTKDLLQDIVVNVRVPDKRAERKTKEKKKDI